jgi:hypothetical protein
MKNLLKNLIKTFGNYITVYSWEFWTDIKADGTFETDFQNGELWSYNGKLYYLCFMLLPLKDKKELVEYYRIINA